MVGKVFEISDTIINETMVDEKMIDKLKKDVNIMVSLRHTNIVECKGVCFLPSTMLPVLVMEKMMTSLHDYLLENSNVSVKRKVSFLLDTARRLSYLHSCTVHLPSYIET